MNNYVDPLKLEARNAPHARSMTEGRYEITWDMAGIVNRQIQRSGRFAETLDQLSITCALDQRISKEKAKNMLRDQHRARFGESPKDTLDRFRNREEALRQGDLSPALKAAEKVLTLIPAGETMAFYKAFDLAAVEMSQQQGITEVGAKSMMKEAYEKAHGNNLIAVGKALDQEHHQPVREAQRAVRNAEQAQMQRGGPLR